MIKYVHIFNSLNSIIIDKYLDWSKSKFYFKIENNLRTFNLTRKVCIVFSRYCKMK